MEGDPPDVVVLEEVVPEVAVEPVGEELDELDVPVEVPVADVTSEPAVPTVWVTVVVTVPTVCSTVVTVPPMRLCTGEGLGGGGVVVCSGGAGGFGAGPGVGA